MPHKSYKEMPEYVHIGEWSWNHELLWSKIECTLDPEDCWIWQGAMSPTGALFGARKNGQAQMTQARRLVWSQHNNQSVSDKKITMQCHNQRCLNPNHLEASQTNRPKK
jgi:hypothetical protein